MSNYKAARELERIRNYIAFNVIGYVKRKRVNQHCTRYYFSDFSVLEILTTKRRGNAWSPLWEGDKTDSHLSPVIGIPLLVNKSGVGNALSASN